MSLLAALWAGLAVADLVRWTPERVTPARRLLALYGRIRARRSTTRRPNCIG